MTGQPCNWPSCQTHEYQDRLADNIVKVLNDEATEPDLVDPRTACNCADGVLPGGVAEAIGETVYWTHEE